MSQPSLAEQPKAAAPTQKQKTNVYTVMLFISFAAILTAALLLYFELKKWGEYPWWKTGSAQPAGTSFIHDAPTDSYLA